MSALCPGSRQNRNTHYPPGFVAEDENWISVAAAAQQLHFHQNTVYKLIRDGKLPALRHPVRIRREDLDELIHPVHANGPSL